ncbi:putative serpin-Z12 [Panicum miliaceum]|uniref:Serpin-Z12 n=1 Tax=Panicum miliaceum TaxID=4540 RepID=A0A3L6SIQ2_PANMI|nr:putative serpin-Z12 [Panicum miliaceum]
MAHCSTCCCSSRTASEALKITDPFDRAISTPGFIGHTYTGGGQGYGGGRWLCSDRSKFRLTFEIEASKDMRILGVTRALGGLMPTGAEVGRCPMESRPTPCFSGLDNQRLKSAREEWIRAAGSYKMGPTYVSQPQNSTYVPG